MEDLNIIQPEEIDIYVQSIRNFQVNDIGTRLWLEHHERIIKLNQQAIVEASGHREEVVKELLVIQDKLGIFIHEMYCILVWRTKILPKLLESDKISGSFFIYTILYHESTVVSLMEIVLFHDNSCEALGDLVIDLIDYCVQGVTQLIGLCHSGINQKQKIESITSNDNSDGNQLVGDEVKCQKDEISFIIGMKCLTILSYLCDKIPSLSTSAARRMTQTHDLPCLLSEILTIRPWLRRIKSFEKFIDGKWKFVEGEDILKVTKVEAQVWFCLRSLVFHRETFQIYEINSFRQRELGKCSGMLNETILDQLPPLIEFKHFLCTLQVNNEPSNYLSNLTLEIVPEIKDNIIEKAKKEGWKSIIEKHKRMFVEMSESEMVEMARRLSDAYNMDTIADIEESQMKKSATTSNKKSAMRLCAMCQKEAEKKCSRCEIIFYCSRDCQVKDWVNHREKCYHYVP